MKTMKIITGIFELGCTGMVLYSIITKNMIQANFFLLMSISLRLSDWKRMEDGNGNDKV